MIAPLAAGWHRGWPSRLFRKDKTTPPNKKRNVDSDSMIAEYQITKDDLSAFSLYHHFHSPTARRQYLRSWFIPVVMLLLACIGIWYLADRERGTPLRTFLDLLPLFSVVPLYLIYFPWAYRRKVRKIIAGMASEGHNRGLFSQHRVAISPEGITDASELRQSSTAWRGVERIARNGDYAFVYVSAFSAIIVPRRAFASSTGFEEFVRAASSYHEKAVA
jgi:hypothetical protein